MSRMLQGLPESPKNPGTLAAISALLLFALLTHVYAYAQTNKLVEQDSDRVPVHRCEVVNAWPHDTMAFTQGLAFKNNTLYESTGRNGFSSLRIVDLNTGKIQKKVDVPDPYFAEGITVLNGKVFQLTWLNQKGFIYDQNTFQLHGVFKYDSEGWGLTNDGNSLIMSDGTNTLRFLDPRTFQVKGAIRIYRNNSPLMNLNELEYIKGEIYANIWPSDHIVRIDPKTGRMNGWIDLTGLRPATTRKDKQAVLNGIAYDEQRDRLFVTGKLWPMLFEIRIKAD